MYAIYKLLHINIGTTEQLGKILKVRPNNDKKSNL